MSTTNKTSSHQSQSSTNGLSVTKQHRESPTFNLKAVVTETGLKPDTLRAWERRYGLPDPDRTSGGHRLYSRRDIEMLKWLIARQDEGLSISRAIKLWRRIEAGGQDPLTDERYVTTPQPVDMSPAVPPISTGNNVGEFRKAWIKACMDFDERQADNILSQAFAILPIETVCYEILQKGLQEVGIGWYEGNITVQQEHFTSALAVRRLETLVSSTPPPTRKGRILAACPPEERHTFGLLLATLFLRRHGWDVVYLGANVPLDRLSSTIASTKPHLVILSAQTLYTASTLLPMSLLLQREQITSAYGGGVFNILPAIRERMPGYFLGERIEGLTAVVEQLLTAPPPMPTYEIANRTYKVALDHFRSRQASIEAHVWQLIDENSDEQNYLKNANKDLAQNIIAALTFGDMELLSTNLAWVQGLLVNYHYRMPEQMMKRYITAYYEAAKKYMDERGAIITDWLGDLLNN